MKSTTIIMKCTASMRHAVANLAMNDAHNLLEHAQLMQGGYRSEKAEMLLNQAADHESVWPCVTCLAAWNDLKTDKLTRSEEGDSGND